MTDTFLEDLTRAGRAVWELYLRPFDGKGSAQAPPTFPVWEAVVSNDIETFYAKYYREFDWRFWLGWSMAFSSMATASADATDDPRLFNSLDKFAELVAIHMGDRCPGMHDATSQATTAALLELREFEAPQYRAGTGMNRFRAEVAAHQEWLYLRGTFIPHLELTETQQNDVVKLASEIENQMFEHADFPTLLGLMVLSAHMAVEAHDNTPTTPAQADAIRRVMCVQAHGLVDAVKYYTMHATIGAAMSSLVSSLENVAKPFDPRLN